MTNLQKNLNIIQQPLISRQPPLFCQTRPFLAKIVIPSFPLILKKSAHHHQFYFVTENIVYLILFALQNLLHTSLIYKPKETNEGRGLTCPNRLCIMPSSPLKLFPNQA